MLRIRRSGNEGARALDAGGAAMCWHVLGPERGSRRGSIEDQMSGRGELNGSAFVGDREALRVEGPERAFGMGWLGACGGTDLQIDRGAGGCHGRAVVAVEDNVFGQIEFAALLQEN